MNDSNRETLLPAGCRGGAGRPAQRGGSSTAVRAGAAATAGRGLGGCLAGLLPLRLWQLRGSHAPPAGACTCLTLCRGSSSSLSASVMRCSQLSRLTGAVRCACAHLCTEHLRLIPPLPAMARQLATEGQQGAMASATALLRVGLSHQGAGGAAGRQAQRDRLAGFGRQLHRSRPPHCRPAGEWLFVELQPAPLQLRMAICLPQRPCARLWAALVQS